MKGQIRCQYFERYGDSGHRGYCANQATLALVDNPTRPPICVCGDHADVIRARFPQLGPRIFVPVESLDEYGRL